MSTLKQITADSQAVATLGSLVRAYKEISVMRIQKTRDSVLKARPYTEGLHELSTDVQASYYKKLLKELKKRKKKKAQVSRFKNHGQELAIFLSPAKRFSGGIVQQVFQNFYAYLQKNKKTDAAVVGKIGKEIVEQNPEFNKEFRFFDIDESSIDDKRFKQLIEHVNVYAKVQVFNAKFESLVKQKAVHTDITADQMLVQEDQEKIEKKESYWFEPDFEEILAFFEKQISAILFVQTIYESRLGNLGSRITTLENASDAIEQRLKKLERKRKVLKQREKTKKRQERLAGMSLWR